MMDLSEIDFGAAAEVLNVRGVDEIGMRLLEMGLTPGTQVVVVGSAPLGDPLEIEVRGYRLSLRRSEAERIEVAPIA